jgi:hypothetical protein
MHLYIYNNLDTTDLGASCSSKKLWNRYGVAIQKQKDLLSEGKITNDEMSAYMKFVTET